MVNIDLVVMPPTEQEFQREKINLRKEQSFWGAALLSCVLIFSGVIFILWQIGRIELSQVSLIVCVPLVSLTVAVLMQDFFRLSLSLAIGAACGLVAAPFVGWPVEMSDELLLAVAANGVGIAAAYFFVRIWAVEDEVRKVVPLDHSYDYAWLYLASKKSDFIANYLFQVKSSGRREIYGEELLRLMPYVPADFAMSQCDALENPRMALWCYLGENSVMEEA